MDRQTAKEIMARVVANRKALDGCAGPHDFVDVTPEKVVGKTYRCGKCTGTIEVLHHFWYQQGLKHARGASS